MTTVGTERFQTRLCPSCGCADFKGRLTAGDYMIGIPGEFFVGQCGKCGLLYQNPSLRPEHLGPHYPDDYGPYSIEEIEIGRTVKWHLKNEQGYAHLDAPAKMDFLRRKWGRLGAANLLLPDFKPDGRLLEIACASGNRLSLLRRLGWAQCQGIEYSPDSARKARERGFTVHTGRVEDTLDALPDASQHAIIASFVLEHLENPFQVADQISEKLVPGGQFLFSTLNIDSPDFRQYQKYWYDLDLPRHFTFFRKRDLLRMLAKDFKVEKITYQPAPNDWIGSAKYRLKHQGRLFDKAIVKLGERLYPVCLALSLAGQASRIFIHARKK